MYVCIYVYVFTSIGIRHTCVHTCMFTLPNPGHTQVMYGLCVYVCI